MEQPDKQQSNRQQENDEQPNVRPANMDPLDPKAYQPGVDFYAAMLMDLEVGWEPPEPYGFTPDDEHKYQEMRAEYREWLKLKSEGKDDRGFVRSEDWTESAVREYQRQLKKFRDNVLQPPTEGQKKFLEALRNHLWDIEGTQGDRLTWDEAHALGWKHGELAEMFSERLRLLGPYANANLAVFGYRGDIVGGDWEVRPLERAREQIPAPIAEQTTSPLQSPMYEPMDSPIDLPMDLSSGLDPPGPDSPEDGTTNVQLSENGSTEPEFMDFASPPTSYANLPKASKRKRSSVVDSGMANTGMATSANGGLSSNGSVETSRVLPEWYTKIDPNKIPTNKQDRTLWATLQRIRTLITESQDEFAKIGNVSEVKVNAVREELHRLEYTKVDEYALAVKRLLDNEKGIPQIFDAAYSKGVQYPWDVVADAQMLFNKWSQRFFDPDLVRGINAAPKFKFSKEKSSWSLVPKYPLRVDAHYFGNKFLVNGQWWPRQICAVRDGAHGEMIAGITGPSRADAERGRKGAVSVVMSGSDYHSADADAGDKDEGDEVWYCGTRGKLGESSESTQHMLDAVGTGRPVRLMRSAGLPASNPYKPAEGFRYDGLYDVVGKELLDAATSHYRFHLVRRAGQSPIRARGVEARPTKQDIAEWHKLQRQLGMKGGSWD